ncbi:unnamed protein product [Linum tenue]|uniref:HMA domain-containing protein n=1 Tax=Linum tenue TaxID=586396 RepID=A0AAV0J2S3_9ROSI|nr:unnamed protein product [Linum tenue]
MKKVTGISGVDSVSMDMKDMKMTVVGNVDPVKIASKLRKVFPTEVVSVGPPKQPEKKKGKKDEGKDKKNPSAPPVVPYYYAPQPQVNEQKGYNNYPYQYGAAHVPGEDPNACVIC